MLASRIEIETKKSGSSPIKIEIESISDYVILRESKRPEIGTTIKLYLKEDISQNLRLSQEIDYYVRHVDIPIKVKENGTENVIYKNAYQTPSDLITFLKKYDLRLYDIPIMSKNFQGLLSLCMRYDEANQSFVPMKRFGNQGLRISWKDLRIISNNGIYVPDTSILPPWLVISPYYVDINFAFEGLLLDASRSRFIRNKAFHGMKNELEEKIIDAFKGYLDSIRSKFRNDLKKTAKIANLFNSHFGSIYLLYVHPEDITTNIHRYTKENYYFRCISEGKYMYMTANQILEKELILTSEAPWEHGNDSYLEELSQSEDFNKNINYVILTDDEVHSYDVREGVKKNSIIQTIFEKEKVLPLADIIKFEIVNILDKKLPQWWKLVKFTNYRSNNISEEFHHQRLLNADHPFIKLIIDNVDLLDDMHNQMYFDYFLEKFGHIRYGYDLKKLREYQVNLLQILEKSGRIPHAEIENYTLTDKDLPPDSGWGEDIL